MDGSGQQRVVEQSLWGAWRTGGVVSPLDCVVALLCVCGVRHQRRSNLKGESNQEGQDAKKDGRR